MIKFSNLLLLIQIALIPVSQALATTKVPANQPNQRPRQCLPNQRSTQRIPCVPRGVPVIDWCKVGQLSTISKPCRNGSLTQPVQLNQ